MTDCYNQALDDLLAQVKDVLSVEVSTAQTIETILANVEFISIGTCLAP